MRATEAVVGEEIDGARAMSEELVVAALERAEPRQRAQVPFPDERGGVTRVAQE